MAKYNFSTRAFIYYSGQKESFRIRDKISVADWIENNFELSRSYAIQGKVKLFPWQRDPVNAIQKYNRVIFVAPVQTGKSMLAEGVLGYMIDREPMNFMLCYAKKETVQDVFDERLKPFVEEIPAICKYWNGEDKNLTKRRIKLNHCIGRVASAGVPADVATFNAGFIVGSEVAKWPEKGFDQQKALRGRQQASRMLGKSVKELYESSPRYEGDKLWAMAHRAGTIYLKPHYQCPFCKYWQMLEDTKIIEIPNKKGERDHDPDRIRTEKAAKYNCEKCKKDISETSRLKMADKIVWAAVDPQNKNKTIEKISPEGKIIGRKKANAIVFNWNRLVDTTWSFYECLACYFESLISSEPEALATYQNEDMARWVKVKTERISKGFLESKKADYYQYGDKAFMPSGIVILIGGIDTQDDGFYYVIRGFGRGMESWLIRSDFIHCDMSEDKYKNPAEVHSLIEQELYRLSYRYEDGKTIPITWIFQDEGGHRQRDVIYCSQHMINLYRYKGASGRQAKMLEQSKNEPRLYLGNTEQLSRRVQAAIESSIWHIPKDIQTEYCDQILNQYDEEYQDLRGNTRHVWVTKEPDHLRDCENYIEAGVIRLELHKYLFTDEGAKYIKSQVIESQSAKPESSDREPRLRERRYHHMNRFNRGRRQRKWSR